MLDCEVLTVHWRIDENRVTDASWLLQATRAVECLERLGCWGRSRLIVCRFAEHLGKSSGSNQLGCLEDVEACNLREGTDWRGRYYCQNDFKTLLYRPSLSTL